MAFASAVAFLIFAGWAWRGGATAAEAVSADGEPRFARARRNERQDDARDGEVGSDHDWAGVWIGTAVGMVVADAPAIGVGTLLHRRLPERLLHALANPLDNALGRRSVAIAVTAVVAVGAATIATTATAQTRRRRRADTPSPTIPPGST